VTKDNVRRHSQTARHGAASIAVVLVSFSSACFLAPAPIDGASEGSTCAADLDCGDGLACECGTCASPSNPRLPPSCDVSVDNQCPSTPSGCFESCGVEVVVGIADCVAGRETCEGSGGVLFDDCPLETCWGVPEPGEVCVDGVFECAYGRNGPTGLCYTFDCVDEPEQCVIDCTSDLRTTQVCVADEWKCESGFPVRQCGGCVGTPPVCVDSCADPFRTGSATCIEDEWSCAAAGDELENVCCIDPPSANITTPEQVTELALETCILGQLDVVSTDAIPAVEWPILRRVGGLFLVSTSVERLLLPQLVHIDEDLAVVGNSELHTVDLAALAFIGGDLTVDENPSIDVCAFVDLVAQVQARDGIDGTVSLPTLDDAGCALPDGGVVDGGEPDAGEPDAGEPDAGAPDAGVTDAGVTDAGALDAGPVVDAGENDAGAGDAGAAVDAG
jgi:hypothetical protein